MRLPVFFASVVLIPFAAHCVWGAEPGNDRRLDEFFGAYLDRWFAVRPLDATRLGDHRFDQRLDDLSPGARGQWIGLTRETLDALPEQADYRALTRSGQIDFEILRHELVKSLWLAENTRPYEDDPRIYNEYISDSVFLLLAQSSLPKETNIANALARMEQIPRVIAAARANLRNPPAAHIETAIGQNRGAIAFYERGLFELAGSTPQRAALEAAAARVVESLRDYQRFLESDLRARTPGEWRLGRERFCRKLELEVDGGVTADEVLADAQREFERVERDMFTIARQLWSRFHPGAPLPPDDPAGRRATVRSVLAAIAQDHSSAETVVADVRRVVADVKRFIADARILRLPQPDQCQIIEMPEFQRGNSTAYMNSPPPLDPGAGGYYAVSPPPRDWDADRVRSYFEEYNSQMLRILTIHEAYPGHYVQLEHANRNPSRVRRVLQSGVYIEGWAVYTEAMMLDQGFGEGSLPLRLTQLKFYLRAVANAILDHKMHCADMSDDEALRFLTEDAFQSEGEARLKIVRAKQSSVQLSTYFAGRMAMGRLRQTIQREMGERFSLDRYHEAVLEPGAVPVKYLPELVRARLGQPR